MEEKKDKVIFILGPTAVGKSFVSVSLAKKINGEIISADSVQIFKGLDIGSAKVTKDEMGGIVHHAIDICEPEDSFTVFDFVEYTKKKIKEICARGKLPIVVGGTGLYVKALTQGFNFGGVDKDENLRQKLEQIADEKGNDALFEMLKEKDVSLAEKTDRFNRVRLVRALEIAFLKGEKITSSVEFESLLIVLTKPREELYQAINVRVDKMIEDGLVQEVEGLKRRGLSEENQSMHAIGYKEVLAFLDGKIAKDEMISLVKQHSRNYAKRQMTFLRGMKDVHMVDMQNVTDGLMEVEKLVGEYLKK